MSPNRCGRSSCSRSSTPCPRRRSRSRSRSPRSWSSSWDCLSRPFAAEQQLLRLRDQSPVPQQEEEQDMDHQSPSNDNAMSATAVRKLFTDLVCPPALSHYANPFPDAPATKNQLVPRQRLCKVLHSLRDWWTKHTWWSVLELYFLSQSVRWTGPKRSYFCVPWTYEFDVVTGHGR